MKKFITLLISGSLSFAAVALAQQPVEPQQEQQQQQHEKHAKKTQAEQTPSGAPTNQTGQGKQHAGHGEKAAHQQNGANATTGTSANANAEPGATQNMSRREARRAKRGAKASAGTNADANATTSPATGASAGANTNANADANVKGHGKHGGKNAQDKAAAETQAAGATQNTTVKDAAAGAQTTTNATATQTNVNAGANVNANVNAAGKVRGHGKGGKQLDPQVVEKVKTEHASFKAQPRPDKAPPVTFTENYRIQGAQNWQGPRYAVFRDYHSERHDHAWYHSHYQRVELIGGGYYYWNSGYWYPAWGYDSRAEYYAYDGPIYVGQRATPPDQVIADVQSILQDAGYYTGEVDGLLGPLTRQALTDYQADNGLIQTAAIDESTLDSLGLS